MKSHEVRTDGAPEFTDSIQRAGCDLIIPVSRTGSAKRQAIFDRSQLVPRVPKEKLTGLVSVGKGVEISCVRCHARMKGPTWNKHKRLQSCSTYRYWQEQQSASLEEHLANVTLFREQSVSPCVLEKRWKCPRCDKAFNDSQAWDLHWCAPFGLKGSSDFPFILLPAGAGQFRAHFEKLSGKSSAEAAKHDWERIRHIESLNPVASHRGSKGWFGYVAYEFEHSSCVVLESPVEGNATYVLGGDWKSGIPMTKAMLRKRFTGKFKKEVHRGDNWQNELNRL